MTAVHGLARDTIWLQLDDTKSKERSNNDVCKGCLSASIKRMTHLISSIQQRQKIQSEEGRDGMGEMQAPRLRLLIQNDIKKRNQLANMGFSNLRPIFSVLIASIFLYSSELWALTKEKPECLCLSEKSTNEDPDHQVSSEGTYTITGTYTIWLDKRHGHTSYIHNASGGADPSYECGYSHSQSTGHVPDL